MSAGRILSLVAGCLLLLQGWVCCSAATLDISYPRDLSRGLVLVKWWLLAIPHYLIIGLLVTNWWDWGSNGNDRFGFNPLATGGVRGLLVVVAGLVLLFAGKYPHALFE